MGIQRGERLMVKVDLLGEPCLWCWEIVDPGDGTLIESSWATEWTGYRSSPEAWRAGILRLTDLTRPSREARLRSRRPPAGGPRNTTVVVARDAGELYTLLKSTFSDRDRIEVIRDRRFGERRHRDDAVRFDRRRGDRRARPHVESQVGSRAPVALVTPSPDPS